MKRACILWIGGVLMSLTAPVLAQPAAPQMAEDGSGEIQGQGQMRQENLSDAQARSHFRVGEALYSEGRFVEAAREFERAYVLSNRPTLLYNAYVAYRDASDLEHAIVVLDEYLRRAPEGEDSPVLRGRLAAMRATVESRMTEQSAVEAERARLEEERAALAREAEAARLRAESAERQVAQTRSPVPWIVGGAGLAILAGAGISALVANGNIADAESACPGHVCPRSGGVDLAEVRDSVRRPALATDVLLGIGGATLVTGIVLLVTSRDLDDEPPAVSGSCDGRGCAASYSFRF